MTRRHDRRVRALRRSARGRVRQPCPKSTATCCAPLARRSGSSELLEAEPDIRAPAKPAELPEPPRGELDVRERHLPLSDAAATRPRLKTSASTVEPRERLAVVGPSGAGKTTIFQLAERFYDPQAGPRAARRRRPQGRRSGRHPPAHRDGAAGNGDLRRNRARQPALRQLGRERGASCGRPRATPMPRNSCARCRKASTRSWAKAARACPAVSASASRSPARCCAMRRCYCSTKRPPRSTPKASGWCRTRSTG